jgi:hypothetical protein
MSAVSQDGTKRQISRTKVRIENMYLGHVYCCPEVQGDTDQKK